MRKHSFVQVYRFNVILFLIVLLLFCLQTRKVYTLNLRQGDLYWISYQGRSGGRSGIVLMQIDQFGNVVRPPTVVVRQSKLGSAQLTATALAHLDSFKLRVWAVHQDPFVGRGDILRFTINKTTLALVDSKRTSTQTTNKNKINVTQRAKDNFLTIVTPTEDGDVLTAFGLTEDGKYDGTRWSLSPKLADKWQCGFYVSCGGGVSANGRIAFWGLLRPGVQTDLVIQPLNSAGRPKLDPVVVASAKSGRASIPSADVTNVSADGKKFVVYVINRFLAHDELPDPLFLQVIDGKTGKKVGDGIHLRTFDGVYQGQSVAVDPGGHFVIVDAIDSERDGLWYQALDATGHASGPMKFLVEGALGRIDILKE